MSNKQIASKIEKVSDDEKVALGYCHKGYKILTYILI